MIGLFLWPVQAARAFAHWLCCKCIQKRVNCFVNFRMFIIFYTEINCFNVPIVSGNWFVVVVVDVFLSNLIIVFGLEA